jgi:hypothetical protein
VSADDIHIETDAGDVTGTFAVHSAVSVASSSGTIDGSFDLHARGLRAEPARQLSLRSTHG